jgi:hypothetical protein
MDYHKLKIMGAVRLEAVLPLAETADKLGAALGNIRFVKDPPGTYDEFPSFSSEVAGLSFVLLGIPAPDDQIGDVPITDYTLQIALAFQSRDAREVCDASTFFADLIGNRSNLKVSHSC